MAMDPAVNDAITAQLLLGSNESARLTGMADRNLTQALGVIQNVLVQQAGGVADDAAVVAALRTAIYVPTKET